MTIEVALQQYLRAQPAVAALIANRLYPLLLPQPPVGWPSVTYSCISRYPERDLSGVIYFTSRFQFSCWSERYGEAKVTAQAIRQALEGYTGPLGEFRVLGATMANEIDLGQPDSGLHHVPVDVVIKHKG